ncbi:tight junction protein ZO-1-like isoform X1 [Dreissena polymorpha]|uniref:tight junction protein ZO-1-like isoform X1 n=1 Tax=Dreissena polymorpha TaxID=45954 RepID=UPI002263D04A|nr:tight junction protein ZO-1-like isoform X1 [Dreissena polymorpha]
MRQAQQFLNERDKALASLENLSAKRNNTPIIERRATSPTRRNKDKLKAVDSDLEIENEENSDNVVWETHKVTLTRVPGFGFGIAVSGGKDNPHFANGDPSIAISDVLKSGPAEGKLQINDRVLSVNGNSLENVDHSTAISVLKDCGSTVNLVIRRRIVLPASLETETPPLKVTLSKRNRKDEYGVVLGCRFFIKEILPNSLAAEDGGLKEGDTILKINNAPIDSLSLIEARKLIEKTKDKLQFIITKPRDNERRKDDEYSLGYGTMQSTLPKHADKVYQTKSNIEDSPYKAQFAPQDIPPGAYPANSPHSRYDGRYIYDHEAAPPRPPLPSGIDNSGPPRSPSPVKGGYLSDGEDRRRKQSYGNYATVDETDIPILRRHHEERYVGKRKDIRPDPRIVTFLKDPELGLGLRLAGGNATGIFIASVQPNTAAEIEGLSEGDQIIKANTKEIVGLTREEAVMSLTSLQGTVSLEVQYKKEELDRIMSSQEAGDSFYIRTHFNHEQLEPGELSFVQGDIFHIKDTLFRGVVGSWLAVRMGRNNQETQKGIIPNKNRAEQLAISSQCRGEDDKDNSPSKRSGLFKRKVARRSKSLSKDHWEDVIFSHLQTKFPAYERVLLRDCGFVRPVVIFGPLADVAREKILKDFPDKFQSPQSEHRGEDQKKGRTGIIRLGAIKDVINRRKHCMLDITPHNVDRLNFAQFYPIVVFLKADCKTTVKELRAKWAKGSSKNPKKLYEHSIKLDKFYQHLFTATVTHNTTETWYRKLVEMVDLQQQQQIWMSEKKPEEDISDDYLFPLSNRLSFSGSHGDASDNDVRHAFDDMDALPAQRKRQLVRSSSDPSVNTMDRVPGIPPYPDPPRYQRQPKLSTDGNQNYQDIAYDDSYTQRSEDRYYPSYYADHNDVDRRLNRHNIDPYATITPSERLRGRMPSDPQWSDGFDDRQPPPPQAHQNEAVYSKPLPRQRNQLSPGNQGHTGVNEPGSPGYGPSSGQQHLPPPPPPHQAYTDSSSYSSDSFTKYTSNPVNKHDDSKLRDKMGQLATRNARSNDPYRFTRSTANKVTTSNIDKNKLSDLSAKFRPENDKLKLSSTSLSKSPQGVSAPNISKHPATEPDMIPGGQVRQVHMNPQFGQGEGQRSRVMGRKQPPPVPTKTYNLKERGIEPDEQKLRHYESANLRGYEYRDGNNYSALPVRNDPNEKHRGYPNDGDGYPVLQAEHYKSEDPYEYVAPRRQNPGNQQFINRNSREYPENQGNPITNQNSRTFMNQIYMDTEELKRYRQEREQQQQQQEQQRGYYRSPESRTSVKPLQVNRYSQVNIPRTDDELHKLRESHKKHSKSTDHVHRAQKSDSALINMQSKQNFSSYKKLITAGVYGTNKIASKSHDELRDPRDTDVNHMRAGSGSSQTGSAFESYSKASPLSSFGKAGELGLGPKSPVKLGQDSQPLPSKSSGDELSAVLETSEPSSNNEDETAVNGHVTSLDQSNASVLSHDTSHDCAFQSNVVVTHNGFEDHLNKAVESFDMLLDKMNQLENGQKSPDQDSQSETVSTPDTVILRGGFDPTQDLDDSHTVVATARGLFNKQGGVLESPETGVSIVIPPGALSGDQDQEIYFKVCRDNSILPPLDREKGETLLSPLVMCGPHGLKFNQPVELRLPHCASVNPDSWSFALKSSDSPSGQPTQWQNMTLAEREGQMQSRVGKNSVSVLVDHF